MNCRLWQANSRRGSEKRCLAKELTVLAIAMEFRGITLVIRIRFLGLPLMLVAMVAEMRGMTLVMLAIDGRSRPGVLERQHRQQQDQEQFSHGRNHTIACMAA